MFNRTLSANKEEEIPFDRKAVYRMIGQPPTDEFYKPSQDKKVLPEIPEMGDSAAQIGLAALLRADKNRR